MLQMVNIKKKSKKVVIPLCRKCGSNKGFKLRTNYPHGRKSKNVTGNYCRNCGALKRKLI